MTEERIEEVATKIVEMLGYHGIAIIGEIAKILRPLAAEARKEGIKEGLKQTVKICDDWLKERGK